MIVPEGTVVHIGAQRFEAGAEIDDKAAAELGLVPAKAAPKQVPAQDASK